MNKFILLSVACILLFYSDSVGAHFHEESQRSFLFLALVSFLAGILSFLAPCTLPVLPAYFSYAFRTDRSRLLLMTLAFYIGLSTVFVLMGMSATYLGSLLNDYRDIIIRLGGLFIIVFGSMVFLGKGFSGLRLTSKPKATFLGTLLFGMLFGVGWSTCVGPILASVLLIASSTDTVYMGGALLFAYASGLILPLIIVSLGMGKLDNKHLIWRFMQGKSFNVRLLGIELILHSTTMLSGLILMVLGLLLFFDKLYILSELLPLGVQEPFVEIEKLFIGIPIS